MAERAQILQVVDGQGDIQSDSVVSFLKDKGIEECGKEYTVVSIMGPQSSGKSTLMNSLVRVAVGGG